MTGLNVDIAGVQGQSLLASASSASGQNCEPMTSTNHKRKGLTFYMFAADHVLVLFNGLQLRCYATQMVLLC